MRIHQKFFWNLVNFCPRLKKNYCTLGTLEYVELRREFKDGQDYLLFVESDYNPVMNKIVQFRVSVFICKCHLIPPLYIWPLLKIKLLGTGF